MTDKQMITDGVDVSECIFHSLTTMGHAGYNYCKCFECACECHNDCHYKQLKRKEEECEELEQTLIEIKEIAENMNNECFYSDFDCKYCDMKNGCTYFNKKQILQKSSEVLKND